MASNKPTVKSKLHTEALAYAARGIPIFPCWPNTKKPLTKNGFKDATTDLEQIDAWWDKWPDANIAFSPADIGQGVIDLDGDEGMTAWYLLGEEFDCPESYTVRTPRGGLHIYYQGEIPTTTYSPKRKRCLGVHIDTRGRGGYVLLPPSVTPDGTYIVEKDIPIVLAPEWIAEKLKSQVQRKTAPPDFKPDQRHMVEIAHRTLQGLLRRRDVAIEGEGGDHRTFTLCCELLDLGLSEDMTFDVLTEPGGWNAACQPPWPDDELRTKIANAAEYKQNDDGSKVVPPRQPFTEAFPHAVEKSEAGKDEARRLLGILKPSDCASLPPRDYVIKGVLAPGNVGCLHGAPGHGKSMLGPYLAYAVAQGRPAFGKRTKKGKVLYVAAEDPDGMSRRVHALREKHGDESNFELVTRCPDFMMDESLELDALFAIVARDKPKLIIVDTLARAFPGIEENSSEGMGRVIKVMRALAQHGAAVVLIHHEPYSGHGRPRGHGSLYGDMDMDMRLEKSTDGIVRGTLSKNRNGPEDIIEVVFRIDSVALGEDEDGDKVTAGRCEPYADRPQFPSLTTVEAAVWQVLMDGTAGTGGSMSESEWRQEYQNTRPAALANTARKAWREGKRGLVAKGWVVEVSSKYFLPTVRGRAMTKKPSAAAANDNAIREPNTGTEDW